MRKPKDPDITFVHFDIGYGKTACTKPTWRPSPEEPTTVIPEDVTCGLCLQSDLTIPYRHQSWWQEKCEG